MCYADDAAVLIAENENNLQRMLFELNQAAKKYNLNISIPKNQIYDHKHQGTDTKQVGTKRPTNRTSYERRIPGDNSIKQLKYDEVKTQANTAAKGTGCLHNTIWKNKHVSITSKIRIYTTGEAHLHQRRGNESRH